jgi:hypothetical protein
MLSFHHNQSDLHALVNGDGSAPYTHWNEGFVNKYSQMRGEATCHVMDAKKEWAEVALLRERAESATNEGRPSEAVCTARRRLHAIKIVLRVQLCRRKLRRVSKRPDNLTFQSEMAADH